MNPRHDYAAHWQGKRGIAGMKSCRDLQAGLKAYLDGELPFAQRAELGWHLLRCARCREARATMNEISSRLTADNSEAINPALRARILGSVPYSAGEPETHVAPARRRQRFPLIVGGGAVAALFAAVVLGRAGFNRTSESWHVQHSGPGPFAKSHSVTAVGGGRTDTYGGARSAAAPDSQRASGVVPPRSPAQGSGADLDGGGAESRSPAAPAPALPVAASQLGSRESEAKSKLARPEPMAGTPTASPPGGIVGDFAPRVGVPAPSGKRVLGRPEPVADEPRRKSVTGSAALLGGVDRAGPHNKSRMARRYTGRPATHARAARRRARRFPAGAVGAARPR